MNTSGGVGSVKTAVVVVDRASGGTGSVVLASGGTGSVGFGGNGGVGSLVVVPDAIAA